MEAMYSSNCLLKHFEDIKFYSGCGFKPKVTIFSLSFGTGSSLLKSRSEQTTWWKLFKMVTRPVFYSLDW